VQKAVTFVTEYQHHHHGSGEVVEPADQLQVKSNQKMAMQTVLYQYPFTPTAENSDSRPSAVRSLGRDMEQIGNKGLKLLFSTIGGHFPLTKS
jgi:hypothetical protein